MRGSPHQKVNLMQMPINQLEDLRSKVIEQIEKNINADDYLDIYELLASIPIEKQILFLSQNS